MIEQCEFTVLSGFLGSGKTTLLSTYLACADVSRVAVIVNDVGEVNIDGAVLALQDGIPMATLSNGCVCCSLTNDLPYTIDALVRERRLSGLPPYTRIILECSGLSDPGGVMRSLSALASLGMRVRVVTTYACDRHVAPEDFSLLAQQVSAAHTIVLTRTDLVSTQQIVDVATEAKSLGPMGRIVVETAPEVRARAAFDAPAAPPPSDPGHAPGWQYESRHPRINVFSLQWDCDLGPRRRVAGEPGLLLRQPPAANQRPSQVGQWRCIAHPGRRAAFRHTPEAEPACCGRLQPCRDLQGCFGERNRRARSADSWHDRIRAHRRQQSHQAGSARIRLIARHTVHKERKPDYVRLLSSACRLISRQGFRQAATFRIRPCRS